MPNTSNQRQTGFLMNGGGRQESGYPSPDRFTTAFAKLIASYDPFHYFFF